MRILETWENCMTWIFKCTYESIHFDIYLNQEGGGGDYAHHNNTRPSGSSDLPTAMQTVVTYIRDSYNPQFV